jgi:hypothetical protein
MQPLNLIAYACIAAGVLAMVPWRAVLTRVTAPFRNASPPAVEPSSVIVDGAPAGTAAYVQALRAELVKEDPTFVLDCLSKGLSVTEAIREAYNR